MNLPNKLTMFRVILIPFFIVFLLVPITPYDKWIALGIFVIASLTDLLDGKIARNTSAPYKMKFNKNDPTAYAETNDLSGCFLSVTIPVFLIFAVARGG